MVTKSTAVSNYFLKKIHQQFAALIDFAMGSEQ